jgi:hypothetical protein
MPILGSFMDNPVLHITANKIFEEIIKNINIEKKDKNLA